MTQQPPNPLLQPPFFTVPGISPSAPISAQVQQIDQLNTILLREIDANFAKFHQIITSRILPEIKRYAIASEPIRETSQFWRAFFETAAAVRVPIEGDSTALTSDLDHTITETHSHHPTDHSYAETEGSFMFQPPVTSTPLPGRRGPQMATHESWEDGSESPFDRIDRKLEEDLRWESSETSGEAPTPSLPSGYSLPGLKPGDTTSIADFSTGTVEPVELPSFGPSRSRGDVTPKAKAKVASWKSGQVTDLRHTPLNARFALPKTKTSQTTKQHTAPTSTSSYASSSSGLPNVADLGLDSDDDSDDFDIKPTMSPPVTMTFHLEPRAKAVLEAARHTPRKPSSLSQTTTARCTDPSAPSAAPSYTEDGIRGKSGEARLILDDLMEEMQSMEDSPRMPTPEAFKRYSILPTEQPGLGDDTNHAARRLFDKHTEDTIRLGGIGSRKSMANTSYGSDIVDSHHDPSRDFAGDELSDDEDEDSFDSVFQAGQTIRPGGEYEGRGDLVDLGEDDSGDLTVSSVGTDMVFGAPSAGSRGGQGYAGQSGTGGVGGAAGGFNIMGPEEMLTYHGGRLEDAAGAEQFFSPSHGLAPRKRD